MQQTHPYWIGTSGWSYEHWRGCFYPAELAKHQWFDYYTEKFPAVEVNATFYRSFADTTYEKWKVRAPQGFRYVLKAPRWITHRKHLHSVEDEIIQFWHSCSLLEDAFALVLLQLAPQQPYDLGLLRSALQVFPDPQRVAVEFRHERWLTPQAEALLSEMGAVYCNVDSPRQSAAEILTSARAYVRLHGRDQWYQGEYQPEDLQRFARLVRRLQQRGACEVYVFFNNDFGGYAPANAQTLQHLLS